MAQRQSIPSRYLKSESSCWVSTRWACLGSKHGNKFKRIQNQTTIAHYCPKGPGSFWHTSTVWSVDYLLIFIIYIMDTLSSSQRIHNQVKAVARQTNFLLKQRRKRKGASFFCFNPERASNSFNNSFSTLYTSKQKLQVNKSNPERERSLPSPIFSSAAFSSSSPDILKTKPKLDPTTEK